MEVFSGALKSLGCITWDSREFRGILEPCQWASEYFGQISKPLRWRFLRLRGPYVRYKESNGVSAGFWSHFRKHQSKFGEIQRRCEGFFRGVGGSLTRYLGNPWNAPEMSWNPWNPLDVRVFQKSPGTTLNLKRPSNLRNPIKTPLKSKSILNGPLSPLARL